MSIISETVVIKYIFMRIFANNQMRCHLPLAAFLLAFSSSIALFHWAWRAGIVTGIKPDFQSLKFFSSASVHPADGVVTAALVEVEVVVLAATGGVVVVDVVAAGVDVAGVVVVVVVVVEATGTTATGVTATGVGAGGAGVSFGLSSFLSSFFYSGFLSPVVGAASSSFFLSPWTCSFFFSSGF